MTICCKRCGKWFSWHRRRVYCEDCLEARHQNNLKHKKVKKKTKYEIISGL